MRAAGGAAMGFQQKKQIPNYYPPAQPQQAPYSMQAGQQAPYSMQAGSTLKKQYPYNNPSRPAPNMQAEQYTQRFAFPLQDTHEYTLGCLDCCKESGSLGIYEIHDTIKHACREDMLMCRQFGVRGWLTIRERKNHRYFPGEYAMCIHYTNNPPKPCTIGVDFCAFSHNEEEQYLWTLEKDGEFSIQEFVLQNRSKSSMVGFTLEDFFRKHGGIFRFLCQTCFYNQPCRISMQSETNGEICSGPGHPWIQNKMLLHINHTKKVTPIDPRPFTHKTAFFLICHKLNFCRKRDIGECKFAHSMVEHDVWMVERDTDVTRDQMVVQSTKYYTEYIASQTMRHPAEYRGQMPTSEPPPVPGKYQKFNDLQVFYLLKY